MTEPLHPERSAQIEEQINALVGLGSKIDVQTEAIREEARQRARKVDELEILVQEVRDQQGAIKEQQSGQKKIGLLVIAGVLILLLLAGLNVYNTTIASNAAAQTRQTNELLLSCLTPGTECSNLNKQATESQNNAIRQTQLVIAVCQRQNPLPPDSTQAEANASTQKIVACVKSYYPDFQLPEKHGG